MRVETDAFLLGDLRNILKGVAQNGPRDNGEFARGYRLAVDAMVISLGISSSSQMCSQVPLREDLANILGGLLYVTALTSAEMGDGFASTIKCVIDLLGLTVSVRRVRRVRRTHERMLGVETDERTLRVEAD